VNDLQVTHAAGSGGLAALGLLTPVVVPQPLRRVPALGAGVLLDVVRGTSAPTAQRVRLVATFTKTGRTLRHLSTISNPASRKEIARVHAIVIFLQPLSNEHRQLHKM
jgi:hypothetical protein